jgi:hypothetical protein
MPLTGQADAAFGFQHLAALEARAPDDSCGVTELHVFQIQAVLAEPLLDAGDQRHKRATVAGWLKLPLLGGATA